MCLGIPGRIVEITDAVECLAKVDVSGVTRTISVRLLEDEMPGPDDWVLVHVGFALSRIDEAQAHETLELLRQGVELQRELDEIRHGTVT